MPGVRGLIKQAVLSVVYRLETTVNRYLFFPGLLKLGKLHLGCGEVRIPGHINVDYRPTRATDLTCDCTDLTLFPDDSFSVVFSNAFMEHVRYDKRLPCLAGIRRILKPGGFVLATGIPDFSLVAENYLKKGPGLEHKTFDTDEVYRYTHGYPEGKPGWWLGQLHKSLFDTPTTAKLLKRAGFSAYVIFTYKYGDDTIRLSQGFMAWKGKCPELSSAEFKKILNSYPAHVNPESLVIEKRHPESVLRTSLTSFIL